MNVKKTSNSKGLRESLFCTAALVVCGLLWLEATGAEYREGAEQNYGFNPMFLPLILIGILAVVAGVLLVRSFTQWRLKVNPVEWKTLSGFLAIVFVFCGAMTQIGFLFSSIPFAAAAMWYLGFRKPLLVALIAIAFPLAIWASFLFFLKIPLPVSPWFLFV